MFILYNIIKPKRKRVSCVTAAYISEIEYDGRIDRQSYLHELPVIKHLAVHRQMHFTAPVTFFVGENGTGKSTLLEAIAVAYGFNPEGGSKNFTFSTNATHSELHKHLSVGKRAHPKDGFFLRAESVYNVATNIDDMDKESSFDPPVIDSYGGVSLHEQSHGESFLSIVQNRFFGDGVYILDEPEAALSPMRLLTLIAEIHALVKNHSQFIIATHSPMLMAFPGAQIWEFSKDGIRQVDYKDTAHYQITRRFLENPEKMLRYLLDDTDV